MHLVWVDISKWIDIFDTLNIDNTINCNVNLMVCINARNIRNDNS